MISRLTPQDRVALFGEEGERRLLARLRGGTNGAKGTQYEQLFTVHRIARLGRKFVEEGEDAVVDWQSCGFIDDVVVRRDHRNSVKSYQLKNSPDVSWTAGEVSIAEDCEHQYQWSRQEGYEDVRIRVICSDEATADRLRDAVPASIRPYTSAWHFPFATPREVLLRSAWVADDFAYLSHKENPTPIEIDAVAQVLIGAWVMAPSSVSVRELLTSARDMRPQLIRVLQPDRPIDQVLDPVTIQILNQIVGFQYDIKRGFLSWSTGPDSGTLPFDCYGNHFARWQARIASMNPRTFDELEGELV